MMWLRRSMLSGFVWLLLGSVVLGIGAVEWVEAEGGLRVVVERWGIWGPLIGWIAKTLTAMTPIGAILLPVAFGAMFPFWTAVFLNVSSGVVTGVAMYWVWRRGNHEFDLQSRTKSLPKWFRVHQADNLLYLIALRQLPWAGGSLADLMAGAHRVPVRTQVLSLVLGNIPGSILYTLIGAGILRIR
jgi:uncharacterized membrane protein YdjX (TVP38/TMEM64 family)